MFSVYRRKSIRKYKTEPVPEHKVKSLFIAAMSAPSAGNERPWHFILVREKELLEKLSGTSPYAKPVGGAPGCIVVCGDLSLEVHKGFWVQDCSAATQNILIAAEENQLGAVWIGVYPLEERIRHIREIFGLPKTIIPFALVPFGFPDENREAQKRFDESRIHYDQW